MDMYGNDIDGPITNPGVSCSFNPSCKGFVYYSSSVLNPSLLKYIGYGNTKAKLSTMTPYAGLCSYVKIVRKCNAHVDCINFSGLFPVAHFTYAR